MEQNIITRWLTVPANIGPMELKIPDNNPHKNQHNYDALFARGTIHDYFLLQFTFVTKLIRSACRLPFIQAPLGQSSRSALSERSKNPVTVYTVPKMQRYPELTKVGNADKAAL